MLKNRLSEKAHSAEKVIDGNFLLGKNVENQYSSLANKEEHFRAFKNLVLFKFIFVTYKRYVLKSCCYLKLSMPQIARQTYKSLSIKDKLMMCDTFKQLIFHAVVLEYMAEPDDVRMTSEDLQIIEEIFKFLVSNIL